MIRTRDLWGATVPLSEHLVRHPVSRVFFHHTASRVTHNSDVDIRVVERIGRNRFGRMSYSWLVHPGFDGVYEGAGLSIGAHTAGNNSSSFGIACVGNYSKQNPTKRQIKWLIWLLAHLIEQGHVRWDFEGIPHNRAPDAATKCPGRVADFIDQVVREAKRQARTPVVGRVHVAANLPELHEGHTGQHVSTVQSLLNIKAGQALTVDGVYGPVTRTAVGNVQRFFNVPARPGVVDAPTWAVLLEIP